MLNFGVIMHAQLIVVFVSGFLALLGIRILISSFDDDDNDGDGRLIPLGIAINSQF